jgi:hypothetical protein
MGLQNDGAEVVLVCAYARDRIRLLVELMFLRSFDVQYDSNDRIMNFLMKTMKYSGKTNREIIIRSI